MKFPRVCRDADFGVIAFKPAFSPFVRFPSTQVAGITLHVPSVGETSHAVKVFRLRNCWLDFRVEPVQFLGVRGPKK
jgi:hypothetical protein